MLTITEDDAHGCFLLKPVGSLRKADLDALAARFDARVAAGGPVPNLVIQSPSFPTWSNFAALMEHLRFIRGHHRQIEKVALVSDARALDIAPRIARLFVSARLRHFPASDLADALDWVAVRDEAPEVELIEGLPDDALGIVVRGVIDAKDYAEKILPAIESRLARHEKIKVLVQVGPEFESFTAGAVWEDTKFGTANLARFSKVALVSDIGWMQSATRIFAPLVPGEVRVFPEKDLAAAKAWIAG
ncbi:MAG TPA: STAS/SEC14 domain-containing protein [Amaricoccus sp.]|nr:STAS/SEC14 domain-containing protein [Amaricoccus sp.]